MRRRERIGLVLVGLATVIGVVLLLTYMGAQGLGPFSRLLSSIGARVSDTESRYANKVRGHARSDSLQSLDVYRKDPAKLRTPNEILTGAFDAGMPATLEGVVALENVLRTKFALMHFYSAWGDKPDQTFPLRTVQAVSELGSIPVITWEPWLTDFENRLHPTLPLRDQRERGGLNAVARGVYDFYVDAWAADAAKYGGPIVIRFAHEMNDPYRYPWGPQNNRAEDYIAAWQHVVYRFRAAGARNVLFAWAPHVAYKGFDVYYPGDEWVDWIATGVLNYGTVARWSEWWSFKQIFGEKYAVLAVHKKPIMIAELGSLAVGGDRAKWFGDALNDLSTRYPLVKSILFFNVPRDATVTYQALDWTFTQDSAVTNVIRKAVNNHFRP
ncbi:MAG TPA: glycosyl hydrolase [Longimicrobiales bacterium]|nr:glycosyl hydrolase [Longimicrobiales bacterium]